MSKESFSPVSSIASSVSVLLFSVALLTGATALAPPPSASPSPVRSDTLPQSATYEPSEDLGPLFKAVQLNGVFEDSKTFVDARPLRPPSEIVGRYWRRRAEDDFDLGRFVDRHFALPEKVDVPPTAGGEAVDMETHLVRLWPRLTRSPDSLRGRSSLLPLPHPYVVPGGRFREIYYWDSYFTMLGLVASGRMERVRGMIDNFAYLADRYGFIPNGNRSYYLTRSQPPFFSSMLALLAQEEGIDAALPYLGPLRTEYAFWMNGETGLSLPGTAEEHVVRLDDGHVLNRYWDRKAVPRPESFREDYLLAQQLPPGERPSLYRNLRAAAASGWDFSSRWYAPQADGLPATATTRIVPVDLNALLYHAERTLARLYAARDQHRLAAAFRQKASRRKQAIMRYLWDEERGFFYDYNFRRGERTNAVTMAAFFPLYYGLASSTQARRVAQKAEAELLRGGGFATTTTPTDQQWDAPNGWPPLQWVAIRGLQRYGFDDLAARVRERWLGLNRRVYQRTGKMVEKYNVVDLDLRAGGGEYPAQDGFGWTNGVALALLRDLEVMLYGSE